MNKLDELVAEKIFGWRRIPWSRHGDKNPLMPPDFKLPEKWDGVLELRSYIAPYSTSLDAAMAIINKLYPFWRMSLYDTPEHGWQCEFVHEDEEIWPVQKGGKTAAEAICKAALEIYEVDYEE